MPRHAMMTNLDVDEELDDFDGAEEEYEEELSPEDKGIPISSFPS
jgi:hypothetical protein